jgi:hypothetical protein
MPLFELNDRAGVHLEADRPVFRRGHRLDRPTVRRLHDVASALLMSMGMTSVEIAKLRPVTPRQLRNVLARDGRRDEDEAIRALAVAVALQYGERWLVGVRDGLAHLLLSLGMDVEDAAAVLKLHRHPVCIRQRIGGIPPAIASRISLAAWNALQTVRPTLDAERARTEEAAKEPRIRRRRYPRPGNHLPGMEVTRGCYINPRARDYA